MSMLRGLIIPTLCVGMPLGTLRVQWRGAARAAFARGAWERSRSQPSAAPTGV